MKKKKTLDIQGFSEMEHRGLEPLTSTLPAWSRLTPIVSFDGLKAFCIKVLRVFLVF
jgi:hypothetical protein